MAEAGAEAEASAKAGAVLAGVLFMVWSYVDRPHMPLARGQTRVTY